MPVMAIDELLLLRDKRTMTMSTDTYDTCRDDFPVTDGEWGFNVPISV